MLRLVPVHCHEMPFRGVGVGCSGRNVNSWVLLPHEVDVPHRKVLADDVSSVVTPAHQSITSPRPTDYTHLVSCQERPSLKKLSSRAMQAC